MIDLAAMAAKTPDPTPRWKVGDLVRIRRTLDTDTHAIRDLLGRRGVVVKAYWTVLFKDFWYDVRVDDRVEPFREYELDWRFGSQAGGGTSK